jgi:hypothetical protein
VQYVLSDVNLNGNVLPKIFMTVPLPESPEKTKQREEVSEKIAIALLTGTVADITEEEKALAKSSLGTAAYSLFVPHNNGYSGKIWKNVRDGVETLEGTFGLYALRQNGKTDTKDAVWEVRVIVKEVVMEGVVPYPVLEFSPKTDVVSADQLMSSLFGV